MPWSVEAKRRSQKKYYEKIKHTPAFQEKVRQYTKRKYQEKKADPEKYAATLKANLEFYHEKIKPDAVKMEERRNKTRAIQQRRRETQQGVRRQLQALLGGRCCRCSIDDYRVLDFDHIDPMTKTMNISQKLHLPMEQLEIEVKKCQLLCANCHRIKTIEEREHDCRIRAFRNPTVKSSFR